MNNINLDQLKSVPWWGVSILIVECWAILVSDLDLTQFCVTMRLHGRSGTLNYLEFLSNNLDVKSIVLFTKGNWRHIILNKQRTTEVLGNIYTIPQIK